MVKDADAASYAFWKMHERHMKDGETKDLKMLGTWVHGPGMFTRLIQLKHLLT